MPKGNRWGALTPVEVRAYMRGWARRARAEGRVAVNSERKAASQARYRRKPNVKTAHAERQAKLYWDPAHRPRFMARWTLRNAIQLGHVKRQPCRDCGKPNAEGHHTDYNKPLDVIWLCRKCHIAEHKRDVEGQA